jgi:DNA-binding XRE family transcriptional regulator
MTFGSQIKDARERLKYSQSKVASLAGTTTAQVCSIEKGKGCNLTSAFKLARAVGLNAIIVPDVKGD